MSPEQTEVQRIIEHLKGSVPLWDSDAQVFTVADDLSVKQVSRLPAKKVQRTRLREAGRWDV